MKCYPIQTRLAELPDVTRYVQYQPPGERAWLGDTAVMCCYFNPCGYRRPAANLLRFIREVQPHAPLYIIEAAYQDAPFLLPPADHVIQLRTGHPMFHKENLLNLLAQEVPARFTKLAWVDADITFLNPDWLHMTSQALEKDKVVQLFDTCVSMDKHGLPAVQSMSLAEGFLQGLVKGVAWKGFHPGFAWAAQRDLWHKLGGLWDKSMWGSGDVWTAGAVLGDHMHDMVGEPNKRFHDILWHAWATVVSSWTGATMGCVPGEVWHHWHGERKHRGYTSRRLTMPTFDLSLIRKDAVGLWQVEDKAWQAWCWDYFRGRNEDGYSNL